VSEIRFLGEESSRLRKQLDDLDALSDPDELMVSFVPISHLVF
jgi:hypothetical protein